jgi:hypothetical protein
MRNLRIFLTTLVALAMIACGKKNDENVSNVQRTPDGKIIVSGEITGEQTWKASEKYLLRGFVYVTEGSKLTIEPGTVIFGDKNTKGTLIVERGGQIFAEGTASAPIVFTSNQPAGQRGYGDWGGLVIAGRAPVNQASPTMEGGIRGTYGGNDENDNSGVIKYVRIEFSGIAFQPNSEINGLTLYGVGRGTKIDYVQVSYCGDDSFEWFGGTVDSKYLVAHRGWDDEFDTDFGFRGRVQFGFSVRDRRYADVSQSNGFESDNFNPGIPESGPKTTPVFANITCYVADDASQIPATGLGSGQFVNGMHIRRNSGTSAFNSVFVGYPFGLRIDNSPTWVNVQNDVVQMRGIVLAGYSANQDVVAAGAGSPPTFTTADVRTWFDTPAFGNERRNTADLKLGTISNLDNPQRLPDAGSPLLTGAVWTGKGADAFFEKVNFRGAFGTTDWTAGWTEFNPQAKQY